MVWEFPAVLFSGIRKITPAWPLAKVKRGKITTAMSKRMGTRENSFLLYLGFFIKKG